jgi:hypothetical protein
MTDEFAASSADVSFELSAAAAPPEESTATAAGETAAAGEAPPPAKPPNVVVVVVAVDRVGATVRVTMMSVPTDLSGRQRLGLGVAQTLGHADDAHDQSHAGGETYRGDERSAQPTVQFIPGVTKREHCRPSSHGDQVVWARRDNRHVRYIEDGEIYVGATLLARSYCRLIVTAPRRGIAKDAVRGQPARQSADDARTRVESEVARVESMTATTPARAPRPLPLAWAGHPVRPGPAWPTSPPPPRNAARRAPTRHERTAARRPRRRRRRRRRCRPG